MPPWRQTHVKEYGDNVARGGHKKPPPPPLGHRGPLKNHPEQKEKKERGQKEQFKIRILKPGRRS